MRTARLFPLSARTAADPEPDLVSLVVIHRAIRQDLWRLDVALSGLGDDVWPAQAAGIRRYATALLAAIHARSQSEDEILWPVIAATAGQAVDLIPLSDDRQAIKAAVGTASQALAGFDGEPGGFGELLGEIGALREMLDEHIHDEEALILPAMRRYLTTGAHRWCERQIQRRTSLRCRLFTLPWLVRHARRDERARLLALGGWTAWLLLAPAWPRYAGLERQAFGTPHGQASRWLARRKRQAPHRQTSRKGAR